MSTPESLGPHTPIGAGWRALDPRKTGNKKWMIVGDSFNNGKIATVEDLGAWGSAEANARFIVRACNAYSALSAQPGEAIAEPEKASSPPVLPEGAAEVERLRKALEGLLPFLGHEIDCTYSEDSYNDGPWPCHCGLEKAKETARSALSAHPAERSEAEQSPLTWTREKPTKPGKYWIRWYCAGPEQWTDPTISELGQWPEFLNGEAIPSEFCGPIPAPQSPVMPGEGQ